jgi:hypothetical protein
MAYRCCEKVAARHQIHQTILLKMFMALKVL